MPIKAVILDVSKTLIDVSGRPVPGAEKIFDNLLKINVNPIFACNRDFEAARVKKLIVGASDHNVITSNIVGGKKGSGKFVTEACSRHGIKTNEVLYLGDSINDLTEAVNQKVIFLNAHWAAPNFEYGLPISKLERLPLFIETYFKKKHLWYYIADGYDRIGRTVSVRALLEPNIAKNKGILDLLKKKTGNKQLKYDLTLHLLASLYLEGIHLKGLPRKPITWCIYPGHTGQQTGTLDSFAGIASWLFRESFTPNLIIRHRTAQKSAYARTKGLSVSMSNQLQTIRLDKDLEKKIAGRCVIVLDDFTTQAHSFESARNFLYNAGADEVICIAVGKYPGEYYAKSPQSGITWNSFKPSGITESNFDHDPVPTCVVPEALHIFN